MRGENKNPICSHFEVMRKGLPGYLYKSNSDSCLYKLATRRRDLGPIFVPVDAFRSSSAITKRHVECGWCARIDHQLPGSQPRSRTCIRNPWYPGKIYHLPRCCRGMG